MNRVKAYDGNILYIRVSKTKARQAYVAGKPVVFCPVKLYPFGSFRPSMQIDNKMALASIDAPGGQGSSAYFNAMVRDFEWYNCNSNETGYYAAFYATK